jgi:hypothetical protein
VSTPDPFGNAVDADTIEDALRDSLQRWLPAWLAHEERRRGWPQGRLPQPRSWPTLSEFELRARDQRPSVVLVSSGTTGAPEKRPNGLRRTWRFGLAVAIAGRDETEARQLAAPYLTAAAMAATTDQTLGGVAENVRWSGADDHAFDGEQGSQTAIYGTDLEVTARSAHPLYLVRDPDSGVLVPPLDPYVPDPVPPLPDTADIDVVVVAEDATP